MSTKAKIGKDWVKCQLILAETGETLHLTFAPGQTKKKLVAHIDGRTDVGWVELVGIAGAAAPYDAELTVRMQGQGVQIKKASVAAPAPVNKPKAPEPAALVKPEPKAPVEAPAPPQPEEITPPVVQEPAVANDAAVGGKRAKLKSTSGRDD